MRLKSLSYLLLLAIASYSQTAFDAEILYDYVVVGGGAGGLTVASRLAENTSIKVLVIEAGPFAENLPEVFIPGMIGRGESFTTLNWAYQTAPQSNLNNRKLTIHAGKALGGSTIINSMISPRAQREQYDAWAALNNNSTFWNWDTVLPFFKKSELFIPPDAYQIQEGGVTFDPDVHGLASDNPDGRLKVGFPNFFFEQSRLWVESISETIFDPNVHALANGNLAGRMKFGSSDFLFDQSQLGVGGNRLTLSRDLDDGNVVDHVGVSPNTIDPVNNTRCSAACGYFVPFQDQPNFTVLTNSTVTRILWAPRSASKPYPPIAIGVEFVDPTGTVRVANVAREVILAAGTIGSPKVMELSGVGNSTILSAAGVETVLDLPTVGENLADHVHSWVNAFTNATITKDLLLLDSNFSDQQLALWNLNRTGLYSAVPRSLAIVGADSVFSPAQFTALLTQAKADIPYYARLFSNGNLALEKGIAAQYNLMLKLYEEQKAGVLEINLEPGYSGPTPFQNRPRRNFTTINAVMYYPLARGRTHIVSSNASVAPLIDPAYWAHPLDVAGHVAGMQLGRRQLRDAAPLSSIYQGEFEPGVGQSDADIEKWGRGVVASDNHEHGSMAMMPQELGGVVDEKLRVYGVQNVRVVDASVIPMPISSHLMSTIYMIGERAAEFIGETWT